MYVSFGSFLVSHAPPVGSYDVTKGTDSGTGPVTFDQGSRFAEKKGMSWNFDEWSPTTTV